MKEQKPYIKFKTTYGVLNLTMYNKLMDLINYYFIRNPQELEKYLKVYLPLVKIICNKFSIDLTNKKFHGDHLGLQVTNKDEFNAVGQYLTKYSKLINNLVIHQRRNRVFQFKIPFHVENIEIPRLEIFEPKPEAETGKLKPGIEHIAFKVDNYDIFCAECNKSKVPIGKQKEFNGSKFFKTKFVNLVEVEFRNDCLGV